MPLVINTNIDSLVSQRQLVSSGKNMSDAMEKISSGKRINGAGDDAAGLAISSRMTSQIRGLNQAIRNANDGMSKIQVADGALEETSNIIQRIRELAIQSANGLYGDGDRSSLNAEVQQLVNELDRIAETTSFNGLNVLDGSDESTLLQVGSEANQTIALQIGSVKAYDIGLGSISGDFIGGQIKLNQDGTLATQVYTDAVTFDNGNSVTGMTGFNEGTTLQGVINQFNGLDGLSVDTWVELTASSVGNGILREDQFVTFNMRLYDGSETSFQVEGTKDLEEMINAINANEYLNATLSENGFLNISSDKIASLSIIDDTAGNATGFNSLATANPTIANVLQNLDHYWLSEGEYLIEEFFGVTGDNYELNLNLYEGEAYGVTASVTTTTTGGEVTNLSLDIDLIDFDIDSGLDADYLERVITHELVHAVTARITDSLALPGWFKEGTSEFIHGADDRLLTASTALLSGGWNAVETELLTGAAPSTSDGYAVSYMMAKVLHQEILDAGNTDGIKTVFERLAVGDDLDTAINTATGGAFNSAVAFETYFFGDGGGQYDAETVLTNALAGTTTFFDLTNADTGSIAGSDYGNPPRTPTTILENDGTWGDVTIAKGSQYFNLIVPEEYKASYASAQLVFTTEDGGPINFAYNSNKFNAEYGEKVLTALGLDQIKEAGSFNRVDIATASGAQRALRNTDTALQQINDIRGNLGAIQNRLQFTVANLSNIVENASFARSRIVDADYALETARLSSAQIKSFAAQSMLAQANALPAQVLSLLRA